MPTLDSGIKKNFFDYLVELYNDRWDNKKPSTNNPLKRSTPSASQSSPSRLQQVKNAAARGVQLAKNDLTILSALAEPTAGDIAAGMSLSAAPIAAGALHAFATGSRWDHNGTTDALKSQMNDIFNAGLMLDDEGNYIDSKTNEIVSPDLAEQRIEQTKAEAEAVPHFESPQDAYQVEPAPMEPLPETQAPESTQKLIQNPLDALSDLALANAVIRGKYGNGQVRKDALGDRYRAVQDLVNQKMLEKTYEQLKGGKVRNLASKKVEDWGTGGQNQLRDQVF